MWTVGFVVIYLEKWNQQFLLGHNLGLTYWVAKAVTHAWLEVEPLSFPVSVFLPTLHHLSCALFGVFGTLWNLWTHVLHNNPLKIA